VKRSDNETPPAARASACDQLLLAFDARAPELTGAAQPLRHVATGSGTIDYVLQRVRRRTVGFHINDGGLTIRAPRWSTLREIEAAVLGNQRWIRNKQAEWRAWREQQSSIATRFASGGQVQYLGRPAKLCWIPRADTEEPHFDASANEIHIPMRLTSIQATAESCARAALQRWLQTQARLVIAARLDKFANRADLRFEGWKLSTARTQWGSCSHDGRIRLNWRLVHFSLPVIDYVIAHELAHLRELNHSVRFWQELARLLPGFETARDQIKRVDIRALVF